MKSPLPEHPHGRWSRRDWLRSVTGAVARPAAAPYAALGQTGRRPPNVVLILADDLGSRDLNCFGATDLITDNLDRLAARGLRFEQFYVTAPACLPSRASLLTGRHPQHVMEAGIGMISSAVTIAELLQTSGYRTGVFGKWHLGHRPEVSPASQGFDRFVGFKYGALDNYSHYYYWGEGARPGLWRDDAMHLESGTYLPDIITEEAVQFVNTEKDRPFFLYLPYNMPHYPLQPPAATYMRYEDIADPARRFYAACVTAMDERIGRVLQAVSDNGLTQDTIVIFLSDHGHSNEADSMGGGGRSAPFRGGKTTLWEGGIRVPCILSWPGVVPQGQVRQQAVMSIDLLPTLAHWCRLPLAGLEIDGHSLQSVIDTPTAASPHEFLGWTWQQWSAVRYGPWKLVRDGERIDHLYNLTTDPGESNNLFASQPDLARRLGVLRDAWLADLARDPRTHAWLPKSPGGLMPVAR